MSDINNRGSWLRLGTLSILYFVQGAPYGFQTACLPIILRESGLSFTALGAMKLLFIPWVCKPLYAPLIDETKSKKWWLQQTMLALGFTCLLASMAPDTSHLGHLSVLMFLLNLFSAAQDIAVDTLAVHILKPHELGAGNTVQVVAYKAGSVFAGGLLLYVRQLSGWTAMFFSFATLYFVTVALLLSLNLVDKSEYSSRRNQGPSYNYHFDLNKYKKLFQVQGTQWMVAFVLTYKLCERAEQTFSLFMVDKRIPTAQLAFWSTIMRCCSLLGSTYGGYALSKQNKSAEGIIKQFAIIRACAIGCQTLIIISWGRQIAVNESMPLSTDWIYKYVSFTLLCVTLWCAGTVTTATFTLMMRLSQTAHVSTRGTHYSLLATCEVLGKLAFATIAGWMVDTLGMSFMYLLFTLLAVTTVPFISNAPKCVTDNHSQ